MGHIKQNCEGCISKTELDTKKCFKESVFFYVIFVLVVYGAQLYNTHKPQTKDKIKIN